MQAKLPDALLSASVEVFWLPHEFASYELDRGAVSEMLRCDQATIDRLIGAGVPCGGDPGEERFDSHDMFNLAMRSGTGRTTPEIAFGFLFRFMRADPSRWVERRAWRFEAVLGAAETEASSEWAFYRPSFDRWLGSGGGWRVGGVSLGDGYPLRVVGEGPLRIEGRVETAGERLEIASPRIRKIVDDLLGSGVRWYLMPESMQANPEPLVARGVLHCFSGSLVLQHELRAAGYEACARRGWLIGLTDMPHAWLEVRDDDGRWKVIDVAMALQAQELGTASGRAFAEFCRGSFFARLVPSGRSLSEALAEVRTGGEVRPARVTTRISALEKPGGSR